MTSDLTKNEHGFLIPKAEEKDNLVAVEETRAMSEVQAALVIAKKFPRDVNQAYSNIMSACERPLLAERARYAYPKGGQNVTGASIRLAETMAQCWGNIDFGYKEILRNADNTIVMAYAWDLQTNAKQSKTFTVPHEIKTKQGKKTVIDPREIYELIANNAARRVRACILGIIPKDIEEAALERCAKTLTNDSTPIADRTRKMVDAYKQFGISIEHVEKKLGHKLDAIIEPELLMLRDIYTSLKDGLSRREEWFDLGTKDESAAKTVDSIIAQKNNKAMSNDNTVTEFFEEK